MAPACLREQPTSNFFIKGRIKIAFSLAAAYKLLLCLDNDFPTPVIIGFFFSFFHFDIHFS